MKIADETKGQESLENKKMKSRKQIEDRLKNLKRELNSNKSLFGPLLIQFGINLLEWVLE